MERLRKATHRQLIKQQELPQSSRVIARRKEGFRRRRITVSKLHHKLEKLVKLAYVRKIEITKLKREIKRQKHRINHLMNVIKCKDKQQDGTTNNSSDISDSGIDIDSVPNNAQQLMMNSISLKAKKRALHRLVENKDNIPRGVDRSLRGEFEINIFKNVKPSNEDNSSELKQNVVEFMNCDNVSKVCPDVKEMHKGVSIRYRLHNLNVLHEQFQAKTGTLCSYSMFCQYIPPNIKKPNVNDWGTCLCMLCFNPQMKLE
ncbi:unnamed protein product, partial [Didymodactylos carnosus]